MAPLRALLAAELIAPTDAYVAEALVRRAEESDVALGVACACLMKAQSEGDVCLGLEALSERVDGWVHANAVPEALKGLGARGWAARLDASSLVSEIGDCPLVQIVSPTQ